MDEQHILDLQTKADRYDRITRSQSRVEDADALVAALKARLRLALTEQRNARWDLALAMSPVRKGVRG